MQRHPAWKKLVRAKQDYARLHSRYAKELDNPISLSLAAKMRFMMRLWAADRPDLYGSWATL
jgi:hypothetical protein